jgi:DEAD/DEAH box helicase domain-containing protein
LCFPRLKSVFPKSDEERERAGDLLAADADVAALKQHGVWANLHDRAATLAPYIRAEEHSAQQPPSRLRAFEGQFKRGEINLLACSTTMEMGVDIGSIEAVLNTNVPPSIANYRQRVGRAGRRGQGFASSLTFARDTPLDREAFLDPITYLRRQLRSPLVKLDSSRIVQRHANALLLAQWFRDASGELRRVKSGDFLGFPQGLTLPPADRPPVTQLCEWLDSPTTAATMAIRLAALTAGTALDGSTNILLNATEAFAQVRAAFGSEWQSLRGQSISLADDGRKGLEIQIHRMCLEPLLKELADRSVLPGHGFPNAVVPFITDCADSMGGRARRQDEEGEMPRNRRYDYPSRNAAVAIREYAPGAETVVDGLVWMSAGVTLNWQRPAHEDNVREVQSIRWSWQCSQCGEADCARSIMQNCPNCGSAQIDNRQFIEPAGFRVDWRSKPHAQADLVNYIEPEPAVVSAREARWQPLLDPRLGRGRATANGLVFHHSRGRNKQGYRICLDCGRAAEEGSPTLADHDALMPQRSGTWRCSGNDKTYAITRPLALGHEILTDVAELQPALLYTEGAAWALVSALREALSRRLGIEPRELGLAVARRTGVLGNAVFSVFLYDQSAGGAGYAPRLLDDLAAVLREAQQVLECPMECKTGCSACVLVADLFAQQSKIDRRAALACVMATRAATADPARDDVTGPGCMLSRPVADAIASRVDKGSVASIWAGAGFDLTALAEPPLSTVFAQAAAKGVDMRLVLPPEAVGQLDPMMLSGLRDASHRHRFLIWTANRVVAPNGAKMLASIQCGANVTEFFSRDTIAGTLGPGWGVGGEHPVVEMPCAAWPAMVRVEPEALERPSRPGDRVYVIKADPGRSIMQFGTWFVARILQPELQSADLWKPGRLVSISYSDRYLKAPLPLTLLMRVVSALRDKLASKDALITLSIETEQLREDRYGGAPFKMSNNWQNEQDRTETVCSMAEHLRLKCVYDNSEAKHARKLTLGYDDCSTAVILFDQGFGYWRTTSGDRHDFRARPAQQVRALLNSSAFVVGLGESYIAVTRA